MPFLMPAASASNEYRHADAINFVRGLKKGAPQPSLTFKITFTPQVIFTSFPN